MTVDGTWYREIDGRVIKYHYMVWEEKSTICEKKRHIPRRFVTLDDDDLEEIQKYTYCDKCKERSPVNPENIVEEMKEPTIEEVRVL